MKSFVGAIKYLVNRFFTTCVLGPLGLFFCLTRFREKNTCYVVSCPHIGDVLFTFGYLNAYRSKSDIEKITVVCKESFKELAEMYPKVIDEIIIVSDSSLKLIMAVDASYFYDLILKKLTKVLVVVPSNHFRGGFNEISRFPGVTLISSIKYGILGLEEKDGFEPPVKQSVNMDELLSSLGIISCRTIILSPFTHGREYGLADNVFESIALRYRDMGYRVLTNVSAEWHKPVKHTGALKCTLKEALLIGKHCSCVVGIRSGFLDLVLLSGTMVLALYQSDHFGTSFFDLKAMPVVNKGFQYRMSDDFNQDMDSIYEIVDNNMNRGEVS